MGAAIEGVKEGEATPLLGTGGVSRSDGVVDSKTTISTSLPPRPFGPPLLLVPGGELLLLQFIHNFYNRAQSVGRIWCG